jgi:hypothetical protein
VVASATGQSSYTLTADDLAAGAVQVKVSVLDGDGSPVLAKYSDLVSVSEASASPLDLVVPRVRSAVLSESSGLLSLAYVVDPAGYDDADVTVKWYRGTDLVKAATGLRSYAPTEPGLYKVKLTLVGSTVARYSNGITIS